MQKRIISLLLVLVQFTCLFLLVYTGTFLAKNLFLLIIELLGSFIAILAIWVMVQSSKLSAEPLVKDGAKLLKKGPYKIIRHPMYLSLILVSIVLLADYFTFFRLGIVLVLILDLIIKMFFEEGQLIKSFPDYKNYMQNSWRIFPYIF